MFQIKWMWKNLKGHRVRYVIGLIMCAMSAGLALSTPLISQQIVDLVLSPPPGQERQVELLIPLVLLMVTAVLLKTGLGYTQVMINETTVMDMLHNIRCHIFKNLQQQDMSFFDRNRAGDLMTRMTGDLDMVRYAASITIRVIIDALTVFIAILVYFLCTDILFTLALCAILPLIFAVCYVYSKKARPMYADIRERLSVLNTRAQENIAGNRVVKAFAREGYEIHQFDAKNADYRDANIRVNKFWMKYYPAIELTAQSMAIIVLLLGGIFVMNGRITMGQMMAFSGLSFTFANPIRNLGTILNDIQRFLASANKVIELYYVRPLIVNRVDCRKAEGRLKGAITFDDVTLKFGHHSVLKHISLDIKPGETVAVMGNTGSGKTILMNLIPRLYDVSSGEVRIDGINIRDWEIHSLRRNIGMATQDVFLFSDTIDGNIAYSDPDMSEEDARHYAAISAVDFASKMSDGYDTLVGERGVGLSGGQKQRIALARALAVKPSILILDDTTSAVDMETEKFIQHNLNNLDFPCTKLIVAQRVSTTKHADRIIVMKDGEISEIGTHAELVRQGGYYAEVCALQEALGGDEYVEA